MGCEIIHRIANSSDLSEISDILYCRTVRIWYQVFSKIGFDKEVETEIREIDGLLNVFSKKHPQQAFEIEALTPHEAFYDVEKHAIEAELKNRLKL